MRPGAVLLIVVLVAGGLAGAVYLQKIQSQKEAQRAAQPKKVVGPPPDAKFLEPAQTASMITSAVSASKPAMREQVAREFVGLWVPEGGWSSGVSQVDKKEGETVVRMWFSTPSSFLGGGFWMVAVVPDEVEVAKDNVVCVQGRIDKVEVLSDGSPIPMCRIVLRDARLLSVQ